MSKQLTENDFKESLSSHVVSKAEEIRALYGPRIGWNELGRILDDRTVTRYPCEIVFNAEQLLDGEFAHPMANSENPEDGFKIFVHPFFTTQLSRVPYLVLYQLVSVNYGPFASFEDAEAFGSTVLGLSRDDYYATLCEMADSLNPAG